jgi:PKD repeat protein
MSALSFAPGRGTVVMRMASSPNLNNVTGTKQTVTAATGLVMLASNDVTKQYWASDESLGSAPAPPTASFTASPTSGTAPLPVQFTDTSTGSPTAWAWDFGDGATSTAQNPQHTYVAAGTYTASLTASNAAGSNAATTTITVTAAPAARISVVGSSSGFSSKKTSRVTLTSPAGASAGDLLVAALTVSNKPSVTAPAGWSSIVGPLKPGGATEVFAYYHVVASGENPGQYEWRLSSSERWGGGISVYRGVDAAHPLDVATPVTVVDASGTATSITAPGVSTVTDGAMLIGGLGAAGSTATTTPPVGWTEAFDSVGGKMSEHAYRSQATAGPSGSATWTIGAASAIAVWMTALRAAP